MAEWFIPVLRNVIAALVAFLVAWIATNLGVEVTEENKALLTSALTGLGLALIGIVQLVVSKWMKGWFLRARHAPLTPAQKDAFTAKSFSSTRS